MRRPVGFNGVLMAQEIEAQMAQIRARQRMEEDARRQREHQAWLRLCGQLAPPGRLV